MRITDAEWLALADGEKFWLVVIDHERQRFSVEQATKGTVEGKQVKKFHEGSSTHFFCHTFQEAAGELTTAINTHRVSTPWR